MTTTPITTSWLDTETLSYDDEMELRRYRSLSELLAEVVQARSIIAESEAELAGRLQAEREDGFRAAIQYLADELDFWPTDDKGAPIDVGDRISQVVAIIEETIEVTFNEGAESVDQLD